jgi:hypothetical protein
LDIELTTDEMTNSQNTLAKKPESNLEAGANDAQASTIYCPYTDRDIPFKESTPEHIIPLALGGMNGFTIPVSKDFNSWVGSTIDGALANDFLVKSKRYKYGVKGHRKIHPENVFQNASNADTGEPLHATPGQARGLRLWDPKQRCDVTGQKVKIEFKVDLDVAIRFVAKVALSAGYLAYGDHFRKHVKHEDFRKIMNQRPTEMGDILKTIEAQYDDRFLEPQSTNQKILRMMMTGFGPHSAIALIPNSRSLSVVVSVLGDYVGMLSVPADTKTFPNSGEFRQGQFFVLKKPIAIRDSIWNLNQLMLAKLEEFLSQGK